MKREPVDFHYEALNWDFIKLIARIPSHAIEKYGSWEQYRDAELLGEKSPFNHIIEHARKFLAGEPYDKFDGGLEWHLAAVAYNAMMAFYCLRKFGHRGHALSLSGDQRVALRAETPPAATVSPAMEERARVAEFLHTYAGLCSNPQQAQEIAALASDVARGAHIMSAPAPSVETPKWTATLGINPAAPQATNDADFTCDYAVEVQIGRRTDRCGEPAGYRGAKDRWYCETHAKKVIEEENARNAEATSEPHVPHVVRGAELKVVRALIETREWLTRKSLDYVSRIEHAVDIITEALGDELPEPAPYTPSPQEKNNA